MYTRDLRSLVCARSGSEGVGARGVYIHTRIGRFSRSCVALVVCFIMVWQVWGSPVVVWVLVL